MKEFLLLIHGNSYEDESVEALKKHMERYVIWMNELMDHDQYIKGDRLANEGNYLSDKETIVSDGPFLEPKEIIGGYILVRAQDLEEATRLAQSCPLSDELSISVRPMYKWPIEV